MCNIRLDIKDIGSAYTMYKRICSTSIVLEDVSKTGILSEDTGIQIGDAWKGGIERPQRQTDRVECHGWIWMPRHCYLGVLAPS